MAYSGGYNSSSTNPGAGTSRPSANLYNDPLSNWADQNSFTKEFWIQQELQQAIYNLTPIRYYFLKLFLSRPMIEKTRSEFTYTEVPFERSSFIATAGVAQGTTNSTQVIPVADGVAATVAVNGRYQYASEVIGIVNSVVTTPGSNTVTIAPALGASLPAVTSGDTFSFLAPTIADGMQTYNNFETVNLLSRFNYITRFMRNKAYTEQEWQELVNSERVNFLEEDKQQMMDQFLFDQMVTFFTDQRGSYGVTEGSGTLQAMSTDGFFSIMKRDGAAYGTATPATLINKFKTLLQDTNVSTSMNERWAIGTEKVLARISDAFKQDTAQTIILWIIILIHLKLELKPFDWFQVKFLMRSKYFLKFGKDD